MSGRRNLPGRGGLLRRSDPAILWVSRASHLARGAFTASTRSHRTCRYPEMLEPRDWPGCVAYSTPGPRSKWRRHPTANNGPAPAVVGSCQARRGLFLGPLRRLGRCIVVPTGGSRGRFAAAARCARSGSRAAGSMRSSVQVNGSLKIAMLGERSGRCRCAGAQLRFSLVSRTLSIRVGIARPPDLGTSVIGWMAGFRAESDSQREQGLEGRARIAWCRDGCIGRQ